MWMTIARLGGIATRCVEKEGHALLLLLLMLLLLLLLLLKESRVRSPSQKRSTEDTIDSTKKNGATSTLLPMASSRCTHRALSVMLSKQTECTIIAEPSSMR
jgi:hypothetical protein